MIHLNENDDIEPSVYDLLAGEEPGFFSEVDVSDLDEEEQPRRRGAAP
jgi:hypothetical protein